MGALCLAARLRRSAVAALLAVTACAGASAGRGPREGEPLLLETVTLEGEPFTVGGPGPLRLVELWATWCAPCGPASEEARAALTRHPRVRLQAVSLDGSAEVVRRAVAASPRHGRQLLLRGGPAAAERLGLGRLPAFVMLDRRGRVVGSVSGLSADLAPALERMLRQAEGRPLRPAGA